MRTFRIIVEKDSDGFYVGSVPELPGCHTQGLTLKELRANMSEAIQAYLESMENEEQPSTKFVKMEKVKVPVE